MNAPSDAQLLQAYAEGHSESAFAELVQRHLDLVHSAAVRMVCDSHLAEDVTQRVFVALAKNAAQLTDRPVLSGWLHRTAQNIAAQTVRTDVRRRAREQEAAAMNELPATGPEVTWEAVAPHLDAALGELNETDRDAVLLRYFEKKSAQEMADIFGISDDAAQKRVSRAVERLREFFSKQNVKIGAGGLAVLISANAVQSAPIGLAAAISTAALAGTAVSTSAFIATTKVIAMTTLQKTVITAALAAAVGTGIFEARQAAQLRNQVQTLQQHQATLAGQIRELQQERDDATNRLTSLETENQQLQWNQNESELLKLRAEITRLQNRLTPDSTASSASISTNSPEMELRQRGIQIAQQANLEFEVEGRLLMLKQHLHLNPDQVEAVRNLLTQKNSKDGFLQAKTPDPDLMALLTSDQQVLLEQLTKETLQNTIREMSRNNAEGEISTLGTFLGLDRQQQEKVLPALADCYQKMFQQHSEQPGTIAMDMTVEDEKKLADQKIDLFKNVLTDDQFAIYRKYVEQTLKAEQLCPPSR